MSRIPRNGRDALAAGYARLADVGQEIDGPMTYDRKPKAAPEEFEKIFGRR